MILLRETGALGATIGFNRALGVAGVVLPIVVTGFGTAAELLFCDKTGTFVLDSAPLPTAFVVPELVAGLCRGCCADEPTVDGITGFKDFPRDTTGVVVGVPPRAGVVGVFPFFLLLLAICGERKFFVSWVFFIYNIFFFYFWVSLFRFMVFVGV